MIGPNTKIAIVDNSIDSTVYNPVKHWTKFFEFEWKSFKASAGELPNLTQKEKYSHVILTGSEASIVERKEWVYKEIEFVRNAVEQGVSVLGSCYGHQLLVAALAGLSHVRRCEHPEIGWIPIQILKNNDLLGDKRIFYAYSLHFDEVIDLEDDFSILAATPNCQIHAFQYKKLPVWGIQAHPEIDIPAGGQLYKNLISLNTQATPLYKKALRMPASDSGLIYHIIKTFCQSHP